MWVLAFSTALLAGCGPGATGAAYEAPTPRAYPARRTILPSGLEIVVDQDDTLPAVGVVWTVRAGSAQDPPDRAGLAHAVEHMVFRARDAAGVSLSDRLLRIGAVDTNATTSHDATTYHAFIDEEAAHDLLELQLASLAAPLANVDEALFAQEMGVVREELNYHELGGGQQLATEALFKAVFPARHPYTRPVGGSRASLGGLTLADARAFVARYYQPPNVVLMVAGDVRDLGPQAVAAMLPPSWRGDPQRPSAPAPIAAIGEGAYDSPRAEATTVEAPVPLPEVWVGWSLPPVAGAGVSRHHLVQHLVENLGAGVRVDVISQRLGSVLVCHTAVPAGDDPAQRAKDIITAVSQLWLELTYDGNDAWFARNRATAATEVALDLENLGDRALAEAALLRAEPQGFPGDILARLTRLSLEDARTFARSYLVAPRARVVVVTPAASPGRAPAPGGRLGSPHGDTRARELAAPPSAERRIADVAHAMGARRVEKRRLPNGLQVIVLARPRMPTTTVIAGFHAPPAPGENPAVRTLLFEAEDFYYRRQPSDLGVAFRRTIDRDSLREVARVLAEGEPAAFRLLERRIDAASLDWSSQDFYRKESFLRAREQSPEHRAGSQFLRALWNGHPYGAESTLADVGRVAENDIEAWVRRVRDPRDGALIVVGDVDADAIFRQAGDALGGWKAGASPAAEPPPPPALRADGTLRLIAVDKPRAPAAALHLGCLLPPARDEAALIRNDLIAQIVDEQLEGTLRTRAAASYAQTTRAHHLRGGAAFLDAWMDVDTAALPLALATIRALMNPGAAPPFDGPTLERLRWVAARRSNLRYGNSDALAEALFDRWNMSWNVEALDEYPAHLAEVTLDELVRTFAACRANAVLTVVADGAATVAAAR